MKKVVLLLLAISVVGFYGCQSADDGNPKEVLNHFFDAMSKKDFIKAQKYATQDSEGMLGMIEMQMKNGSNEHGEKMIKMIQNSEIGDAVISGDKATVSVKDKTSGDITDFLLKKENGDWKVAFDMSTLIEMSNKKMKENNMKSTDSASAISDSQQIRKEENEHAQQFMKSVLDSIRLMKEKKLK
jgi:hypothetical protein